MRISTFNVQNLRLRRDGAALRLDGAHDEDADAPRGPVQRHPDLDLADRKLTAQVIARANADIVAFQEVFDQATLDHFHDAFLADHALNYPYRYCSEGNDGRSSDVAVMSRRPLDSVVSHAQLSFADLGAQPPHGAAASSPVFRRDCLAVRCGPLWLFICHFKAQSEDSASALVRRAEAQGVRRIIERSVADPLRTPWLALGDFNAHDAAGEADLTALTQGFAVDLGARSPAGEGWTFYEAQTRRYSRPDRIFAAPGSAAAAPRAAMHVVRLGIGRCAQAHTGERLSGVGHERPRASDHALVFVEF